MPDSARTVERPTILLDCDPGHDDAIAIVVAARHTNLAGITTVAGNAPLPSTTHNALVMRELLGIDVPVHSGAARPLVGEPTTSQIGSPASRCARRVLERCAADHGRPRCHPSVHRHP